ncbi:helix-turn-helix domain-containing protein [Cardiobacteriaceae bacterium TAE3-ERU3]|nr:helix-turn-helix domain-containing protein [Cardiobacteriaceae bacterium TAE3-ERU3]
MYTIGQLAKLSGVKATTIRYYESINLLDAPERSAGNQRRYPQSAIARLAFIRHARALGFGIDAIANLIQLQNYPDQSCAEAAQLAGDLLANVRERISQLQQLEKELSAINDGCQSDDGTVANCHILGTLTQNPQAT